MRVHLAILKRQYLNAILDGRKRIESRFMKSKCLPYGKVDKGDIVYLKQSGGAIVAVAKVSDVKCYESLNPSEIHRIRRGYDSLILGNDEYWEMVSSNCTCGFLAWLCDVRRIEPVKIAKRDMRAWVILKPEKDYGLLSRDDC